MFCDGTLPSFPFGWMNNPIRMMERDVAGNALKDIREATSGFAFRNAAAICFEPKRLTEVTGWQPVVLKDEHDEKALASLYSRDGLFVSGPGLDRDAHLPGNAAAL